MRHEQIGIKNLTEFYLRIVYQNTAPLLYSPFYMMFHRQPRLFVESELIGEDDVCKLETDPDAFIEKMLKRQSDVKSKAPGNIAKAQAKQKIDIFQR